MLAPCCTPCNSSAASHSRHEARPFESESALAVKSLPHSARPNGWLCSFEATRPAAATWFGTIAPPSHGRSRHAEHRTRSRRRRRRHSPRQPHRQRRRRHRLRLGQLQRSDLAAAHDEQREPGERAPSAPRRRRGKFTASGSPGASASSASVMTVDVRHGPSLPHAQRCPWHRCRRGVLPFRGRDHRCGRGSGSLRIAAAHGHITDRVGDALASPVVLAAFIDGQPLSATVLRQ